MPQQSDAAKKRLELRRLEQFRRRFLAFPTGLVAPGEEPDFLVTVPERTVGIEMTELHREVLPGAEPPQVQEALRRRVIKRAEALYAASGQPLLHVFVHFSGGRLSKGSVEPLAQELTRIIASRIPGPSESLQIEFDYENPKRLPPELDTVTTYNLPGAERSFFSAPGSTWMAQLQSADVDRALRSKESKYATYRGKCDEAWLIIGCNGEFMSTWFEGVAAASAFGLPTSFDRVFLMSYFDQEVVEL